MTRKTTAYVLFFQIYGADKQIPDSAQTATAILGGVKVNYKTVGVTDAVPGEDCDKLLELGEAGKVTSVLRKALREGVLKRRTPYSNDGTRTETCNFFYDLLLSLIML